MSTSHSRSRSLNSNPTPAGFSRTSRELAQNIAVQCLSPTLPRDVPRELLERSRKLAEDQRRIIADRADSRGDRGRTTASSDEAGDDDDKKSENDSGAENTSHEQSNDRSNEMSNPPATTHRSAPNSPRASTVRPAEPRSAPPYPVSFDNSTQAFNESASRHHSARRRSTPRYGPGGPLPGFYGFPRAPPLPRHRQPIPAGYNVRMGPHRRFGAGHASPYGVPQVPQVPQGIPPAPPLTAGLPARPSELYRRLDSLEALVGDLAQQVSDLQHTNRKLLDAHLQQSQLVNLYGLAQSGTLSPTQFAKFMAGISKSAESSAVATPVSSEASRSAPGSGRSSRSRASSTDLQTEIYDIIQREQEASDRARGLRLAPNEIPPESELMPSPRLHPPSDWGRLDRSKAPPSEVKAVPQTDKPIPLAGRRCGRFFSLNLDALRQSSQPAKSAESSETSDASAGEAIKQESAEPDCFMPDAEDSDDYDEPAESAFTPEPESYVEVANPKPAKVPSQFMSMCTKMWHVLEA